MKHRAVLVVLCLCASLLSAQATPSPAAPASKADVQKLFDVMNLRSQMLSVMDEMVKQQSQMMRDTIKRRFPQISDSDIERMDATMHEMMKEFPYADMLNAMIPVYQKHLTKGDVTAMTAFYSSRTGKKILHEMPAMTAESMQAAYPTMQAYMEKVMARVDAMAKEQQKTPPQDGQK